MTAPTRSGIPLRDELEDGAGAEAEADGHRQAGDRQRDHVLVGAGQHERERAGADERDDQHVARPDAVREPAADRAGGDREQREAGGARAGVRLAQVVHAVQQLRQVEEHRHEAAEGHEVEERQRPGAAAALAAERRAARRTSSRSGPSAEPGASSREQPEDDRHQRDQRRRRSRTGRRGSSPSTIRGAVSAPSDGAAHADAVDAEREALAAGRVPLVHERHADRERRAGEAEQEAEDEHGGPRVVEQREADRAAAA